MTAGDLDPTFWPQTRKVVRLDLLLQRRKSKRKLARVIGVFLLIVLTRYAEMIKKAFAVKGTEMQQRARSAMSKFSDASFETAVVELLKAAHLDKKQ